MSGYTLYYSPYCPYCQVVVNQLSRFKVKVALKNTMKDKVARKELIDGGGKGQVPCLLIENDGQKKRWMYESQDILRFLES